MNRGAISIPIHDRTWPLASPAVSREWELLYPAFSRSEQRSAQVASELGQPR
jgi:hypothetical protein